MQSNKIIFLCLLLRAFVCAKNMPKNIVYVCYGANHPALYCDSMAIRDIAWVLGSPPTSIMVTCPPFTFLM
jgi:tRNA U34 2-thiouridine synthase MnmA/TrmU